MENNNFYNVTLSWLNSKQNIKIQSKQKYENIINNYIKKYLANISITNLAKEDIVSIFNKLTNENVSYSVQKTILYIIKSSILYKNINYINLKDIKLKSLNRTINVLSKNEQLKLEIALKKDINIRKLCLLLCLYTGLRIGEICGLRWEDIDFNSDAIQIKRTIERIRNSNNEKAKTILIVSTPKSISSNRTIPIPKFIMKYLKEFKNNDNFYLLSNSEKLYDPRIFEAFYERFLHKCGIPYANFHTLRHTFATRSIESKMDIKSLSEILGHSSIEITLKLYVHPSYELKKLSIENLVRFMNK